MSSAIKQRPRPCCINFSRRKDFVFFFFAEFLENRIFAEETLKQTIKL